MVGPRRKLPLSLLGQFLRVRILLNPDAHDLQPGVDDGSILLGPSLVNERKAKCLIQRCLHDYRPIAEHRFDLGRDIALLVSDEGIFDCEAHGRFPSQSPILCRGRGCVVVFDVSGSFDERAWLALGLLKS